MPKLWEEQAKKFNEQLKREPDPAQTPSEASNVPRVTTPLSQKERAAIAGWLKKSIAPGVLWMALQPESIYPAATPEDLEARQSIRTLFERYQDSILVYGSNATTFNKFLAEHSIRDAADYEKLKSAAIALAGSKALVPKYLHALTQICYGCPSITEDDFEMLVTVGHLGTKNNLPKAYAAIDSLKPEALKHTSFKEFKEITAEVVQKKLEKSQHEAPDTWQQYLDGKGTGLDDIPRH